MYIRALFNGVDYTITDIKRSGSVAYISAIERSSGNLKSLRFSTSADTLVISTSATFISD